ncbi:MAG: DUF211 domain-containing protein [Candidatus Nanohaloarchaea archaeon]
MAEIRRLVMDVLKPHEPGIIEITEKLAEIEGVKGVNSTLIEVDEEVKNLKITVEGEISEEEVRKIIENEGASIHSVDEVVAGKEFVEKTETPQDK